MLLIVTAAGIGLATVFPVYAEGGDSTAIRYPLLPSKLKWVGGNPALPQGVQFAFLFGDPKKPGPYIFRVKFPKGTKIAPHSHPDARTVTVIRGTTYRGAGDKFDTAKLVALPAGSFNAGPAGGTHYWWAKAGEVIPQVSGTGPTGIDYVNPNDDPRKK